MKIAEVINYLEGLAPLTMQESYDNAGLIVGDKNVELTNVLVTLDSTEEVVDEAIANGCNLIIAHHPIVFKGLKKITGKNYVERTIIKAIKNDVAIYAIHTNLDNFQEGVNKKIGDVLGLSNSKILAPSAHKMNKISVFIPINAVEKVKDAMFEAGAGKIGNYSECSFDLEGTGNYKANDQANPYVGKINERHFEKEIKVEMIANVHVTNKVVNAMLSAHPYEEVAHDIYPLENKNIYEGAGMFADLDKPISTTKFLQSIKEKFNCQCIRHTNINKSEIKRIAWCGGSGSFLLSAAKSINADIFITGDFKYHEFFDAENQIIIADIGHFESEQFTVNLIADLLAKKFTNFAAYLSKINTNPIKYL